VQAYQGKEANNLKHGKSGTLCSISFPSIFFWDWFPFVSSEYHFKGLLVSDKECLMLSSNWCPKVEIWINSRDHVSARADATARQVQVILSTTYFLIIPIPLRCFQMDNRSVLPQRKPDLEFYLNRVFRKKSFRSVVPFPTRINQFPDKLIDHCSERWSPLSPTVMMFSSRRQPPLEKVFAFNFRPSWALGVSSTTCDFDAQVKASC
jgi:hypothetical protein